MVRESGISATKPVFPSYLLPSLRIPFINRRSSSSSSSTTCSGSDSDAQSAASPSTAESTPNNSPPKHGIDDQVNRLSRRQPDTLRCGYCSTDLAFASQIVSKGFTGRHGKAFLVAPQNGQVSLLNLRVGRNENRQLVTGWHVVADISCGTCSTKLGWKYVDAKEMSQKYKVGKFILETERVVTHRSWEDGDGTTIWLNDGSDKGKEGISKRRQSGDREEDEDSEEEIAFDSEDEEECEDIFAGTWNAETVAKRRRSLGTKRKSATE